MVKIYIKKYQLCLEKSNQHLSLETEPIWYSSMPKQCSSNPPLMRCKTLPVIPSPVKRKVLSRSLTWSKDYEVNSHKRSSILVSTGSTPNKYPQYKKLCKEQPQCRHSVLKKRTCSVGNLFCCFFGIIFFMLMFFYFLSLLTVNKSDCNLTKYIHQLDSTLLTKVYGQHIAVEMIIDTISKYFNEPYNSKPLVLSFHGWSGCGKTWISRLISNLFRPNNVHIFPLPSKFEELVDLVTDNLGFDLFSDDVSQCPHVIVLDDMNKVKPNFIIDLTELLKVWNSTSNTWKKTIFLLLSSTGDLEINDYVFHHRLLERSRVSFSAEEFLPMLNNSKEVWYKPLLENQLIDAFVPFLPLEREHLRLCIEYQLKKKEVAISEETVESILNQINFFPESNPLFSKSGCKKIATKVYLITG